MSDTKPTVTQTLTNPLQTNNSALMIVGYVAGVLAAKLPIFDFATWNYIILGLGGIIFTGATAILNRKSAVVATVADMPEVTSINLDKTVAGSISLSAATPANVVAK